MLKNIRLFEAWQKFWFQEQPVTSIALFRIFFGLFVLQVSLVELLPNFFRFFGVKSIIDTATVFTYWWQSVPICDIFLLLPQTDICRWIFFWIFIIFAIFLTLGFCTRLSAIIVYFGLLTLDRQCPFILDGGDDLMRIFSLLIIFSSAGEAYSLDRLLKAKKQGCRLCDLPPVMAWPWAQRLIQIQISFAYLDAFINKIIGQQWQAGTAVYYASQAVDIVRLPLPWLTTIAPFYQILTYYTLFIEFAMAVLVWIKPLRYWILFAAALLHIGMDLTLNLPGFQWLFICAYINFIEPIYLQTQLQKILTYGKNIFGQFSFAGFFGERKKASKASRESKTSAPQIIQSNFFVPLSLILASLLFLGFILSIPLREKFFTTESKNHYLLNLGKLHRFWTDRLAVLSQVSAPVPDTNEDKLNAEECLATVLSLQKDYPQSGKLLRNICQIRSAQNKPYNAELIRAFSTLANIYLEAGHLDAAELCYQTIFAYDNTHLDDLANQHRLSTDLNNLGAIYYFRALSAENQSGQLNNLAKADTYFRQALNKLYNCERSARESFSIEKSHILSNRYLTLRELSCFKEARLAKAEIAKLYSDQSILSLP